MDHHLGPLGDLILLSFLWGPIPLRIHPGAKRKPEISGMHCRLDEYLVMVRGSLLRSIGGRGFSIGAHRILG